ncbi:MAG: glutaminase [Synechococcales cyanobacterium M58_A2018_015]|nr:glutaminase [Synechococcales cyanobacterium M58_A2018_015]
MESARAQAKYGHVAKRIPCLATANPDWFAVWIEAEAGFSLGVGNQECVFPLMSVIKPFVLLYLLEQVGAEAVFQWVGIDPSHESFNSLDQLRQDKGRPRNPMINSGAITLAARLPGQNASDCCQQFCRWLNQQAGCQLFLDQSALASVRSTGRERNYMLSQYLVASGAILDAEHALNVYEHICCLAGQVQDLARLGTLLAGTQAEIPPVRLPHRQIVNALMLTCGLYEASGRAAVTIGLPIKSGISGALVAVVPRQGAIACYSPALDAAGNSIAGIAFLESLSQSLQLSLFL